MAEANEDFTRDELAAEVDAGTLAREGAPGAHPDFDRLVRIIWRLRQPDGCPWDKVQTHASIRRNMIEEAYEAADAIDEGSDAHLAEELGDVLMQVLLHAQMGADEGSFTIDDVVRGLNEKLLRRHPHVFGEVAAEDATEALASWEAVKDREREAAATAAAASGETGAIAKSGLLDSVPHSFPALMQCQKISKRAARAGFDWPSVEAVWEKVAEEKAELDAEEPGSEAWEGEFGDLLFSLVNVARWEGVDAERALERANAKFRLRWARVEAVLAKEGLEPADVSTARLNEIWDSVKDDEGDLG